MGITVGLKGTATAIVNDTDTAKSVGSGSFDVFATPMMVALMEKASCAAIDNNLDEGSTTVGTMVNVEHLSATPIGMKVTVESTVTAGDGRKIGFETIAYDEAGVIGKGTHDRFVVNAEKFTAKTYSKKQ